MAFPDAYGWFSPEEQARSQLSQGSSNPTIAQLVAAGLIDPTKLPPELLQQASQSQDPVEAFIQSLPPEVDRNNPTAILQAASTNPSMAQAIIERFGIQNAGDMTFENPYRAPLSEALLQGAKDVLIPYGAAAGAASLAGQGFFGGAAGGAASGGYGGAATTYPLASSGGAITATPINALTGTVAGSTTAAGVAGGAAATGGAAAGGAAASNIPAWIGNYLMPGVNAALGVYGANQASNAMSDASDRAIAEGARQYDQTRSDLQPWMTTGQGALGKLQDPNANFLASPDYEFVRGEGTRGIENRFSARGGAQSGNALRALSEFNSNLASGEFGNWWNRQAGLAGVGQTATSQVGAFGANNAANTGNTLVNQGVSRASGILGKTNAVQNGLYDSYENFLYRPRRRA